MIVYRNVHLYQVVLYEALLFVFIMFVIYIATFFCINVSIVNEKLHGRGNDKLYVREII